MASAKEITLSGMSYKAAMVILKWVYSDILEESSGISFSLELLRAAGQLVLPSLKLTFLFLGLALLSFRIEESIIPSVTANNCVSILVVAHEIQAKELKQVCTLFYGVLISQFSTSILLDNWGTVPTSELSALAAPLLYDLVCYWPLFYKKKSLPLIARSNRRHSFHCTPSFLLVVRILSSSLSSTTMPTLLSVSTRFLSLLALIP